MRLHFPRALALALFFLLPTFHFAQSSPPNHLLGDTLQSWLRSNWFDGYHNTLGYDGTNGARSYMYNIIDNHNDTVTCVYSGHQEYRSYDISRSSGTLGMTPINCEHTVPQSFFDRDEPMKSDIHHLFPTYGNWNSTRSNHPFGEIEDSGTDKWMYLSSSQSTIPTNNINRYSESAASIFEPREDHKGNLARAVFYFYTMYPTEAGPLSDLGDPYLFYVWHVRDTIDAAEWQRNEDIFLYQGNRNPYIVYPDLIKTAFAIEHPSPEPLLSASTTELRLDWSDLYLEESYQVFRSVDNLHFSPLGSPLSANTTSYVDATALLGQTYFYYVAALHADGDTTRSDTLFNELAETTTSTASDLILSEYVEGSSFNKALEIANFTGSPIDLSQYRLGRQTNGAGSWSYYPLSGSLANEGTLVIANANTTDPTLQGKADILSNNSVFSFNGNDPIGLFPTSSTTAIDMIGTADGGSANFAKDVTLVRKATITEPNASYASLEWDSYTSNSFGDLSQHQMNLDASVPLELLVFEAQAAADGNWIRWQTAREHHHAYLELERSVDGRTFSALERFDHDPSAARRRAYQFYDRAPLPEAYYRLRWVDDWGGVAYSPLRYVERSTAVAALRAYPNPADGYVHLDLPVRTAGAATLRVVDYAGMEWYREELSLMAVGGTLDLGLADWRAGMYWIELRTQGSVQRVRLVVQ
ncbi:MAG: endonuclease [Bacteroidota bacterium]